MPPSITGSHWCNIVSDHLLVAADMPDVGGSFAADLLIDEITGENWEGGAQALIDGLAPDLSDLRVTNTAADTGFKWGLKQFDQTPGSRKLKIAFGVPSADKLLAVLDTTYRVYRGGTGGTTQDKAGVVPLGDGYRQYLPLEEVAGDFIDWTPNGFDGVRSGVVQVSGLVALAQDFDDPVDYISVVSAYGEKATCTWTVWFYPRSTSAASHWIQRWYRAGTALHTDLPGYPGDCIFFMENNVVRCVYTLTLNIWTQAGVKFDGTDYTFWFWNVVDGYTEHVHTATQVVYLPVDLGDRFSVAADSIMDESIFHDVCRSIEWNDTYRQMTADNDAFWIVGEEQAVASIPVIHRRDRITWGGMRG